MALYIVVSSVFWKIYERIIMHVLPFVTKSRVLCQLKDMRMTHFWTKSSLLYAIFPYSKALNNATVQKLEKTVSDSAI